MKNVIVYGSIVNVHALQKGQKKQQKLYGAESPFYNVRTFEANITSAEIMLAELTVKQRTEEDSLAENWL